MSQNVAAQDKTFFGHPRGLSTLFFTEMWERFSYYGMRALLVLFMVSSIENGGFGFDDSKANAIYGLYTGGVYLLALLGGWLADRYIGQRKAVWYGGILIAMGHFSMAFPSKATFFLGLILIVIGTGLLKPNVSTIVGELYPEGGSRRDAGFSIFYTGINLGAFLGPIICSYLGENVNWHYGFGMAGIGMVLGLIQYKLTEKYLGDCGVAPNNADASSGGGNSALAFGFIGFFVAFFAVLHFSGVVDLLSAQGLAKAFGGVIALVALFYFSYQFIAGGHNAEDKKRIFGILILFVASATFWSGFEQAGSSLNLFAKYFTQREILDFTVPAGWFQSINPIFIIILAPFFGALWIKLGQRNMDPSIPVKFALGLIFLGLGFFVMVAAAKLAIDAKVGAYWLILTYLLHTTGELCLSPVGLSTITKLAPKRIVGQMMGIWFLATSLGNLIAGLVAGRFDFSPFENADKALGVVDGALAKDQTTLTGETLAQLQKDASSIIDQLDPSLTQVGADLNPLKSALSTVIDQVKTDAVQDMPNLFLMIVFTTVGVGLFLLVFSKPFKKFMRPNTEEG